MRNENLVLNGNLFLLSNVSLERRLYPPRHALPESQARFYVAEVALALDAIHSVARMVYRVGGSFALFHCHFVMRLHLAPSPTGLSSGSLGVTRVSLGPNRLNL